MRVPTRFLRGLLMALLLSAAGRALAADGPDHRVADAAQKQDKQVIPPLLQAGADPNLPQSALHWAVHWDDVKLGATPLDAPGYFKPPTEGSEAFQFNQSQRYGGVNRPEPPAQQK